MKRILFSLALMLFCVSFSSAQLNINDYKYVIVEKQFHFQNEANEFNLNGMVRFQFRKHGFIAIIEGETLPDDLKSNYCLALNSEIKAKGSLRTKTVITLTDCDNNVIFTSIEGSTKEKDFSRAYDLAIRSAFTSFEGMNYKYKESDRVITKGRAADEVKDDEKAEEEIEKLKAEIKELKEDKKTTKEKSSEKIDKKMNTVDKSIKSTSEITQKKWSDGLPVYRHNDMTFFKRIESDKTVLIDENGSSKYKMYKTDKRNVSIFMTDGYQGVAFYSELTRAYTLQHYNEKGKLLTQIFRLN